MSRRPRLWVEAVVLALGYGLYSLIRNHAPTREQAALDRARDLLSVERWLHIDIELAVNHAADRVGWLIVAMNYYYAVLHFVVTLAVLGWLYVRHPDRYAAARTTLYAATILALSGYYFFALAPPRFLTAYGFVDTVVQHHTWGSMASGNVASVANQYAAMPSVHITWAFWSGIAVFMLARHGWLRVLGACYPLATGVVIVATANHFVLDIAGGLVVLGGGLVVQRLSSRLLPQRTPAAYHPRERLVTAVSRR